MYRIEISLWTLSNIGRVPVGRGLWQGNAKSTDSAQRLARHHILALFKMKYNNTPALEMRVVSLEPYIDLECNLCKLCLARNSCAAFVLLRKQSRDAYISSCDDYIEGAQISVERYAQLDSNKDDLETSDDCDLNASDDNNLCALCSHCNSCSTLRGLRKRGISLESAHISECNGFLGAHTQRLMRCKYCGTLQDEPQGAKICIQCGGSM